MDNLEIILKYKMNETEKKAYKIGLIWEKLCEKEFPNEVHSKFPKNKDPRKSTLFRYCYKLAVETKGLIKNKEYFYYVLSQLKIFKAIQKKDIHALIGPQILVGDKAWKRWSFWKNKLNKKIDEVSTLKEAGILTNEKEIIRQLTKTKSFLDKIKYEEITSENINYWIYHKKISPFYVTLSDFCKKFIKEFDYALYRPSITPLVEDFFKKEFEHETKYI